MNNTNDDSLEIELKREEISRIISFSIFCAIPATILISLVFLVVAYSKNSHVVVGMGIPSLMGVLGAWLATFKKPNYSKESLAICALLSVGVLLSAPFMWLFLASPSGTGREIFLVALICSPSVMAYKYIRACFAIKGAKNA